MGNRGNGFGFSGLFLDFFDTTMLIKSEYYSLKKSVQVPTIISFYV